MKKIRVDFNRRGRDGQVVASARRADSELIVGDRVEAAQPEEGLSYEGIVTEIDDRGRVFLRMLWTGDELGTPVRWPSEINVKTATGFSQGQNGSNYRRLVTSGSYPTLPSSMRAAAG